MRRSFVVPLFLMFFSAPTWACTFIALGNPGDFVSAQNFDFISGTFLGLIINKRNVKKSAEVFDGLTGAAKSWVAKYGSVTFGFGREQTITGVNERGLSGFRLVLENSEYPKSGTEPAVQENYWLQYLLDTSATVPEAIANAKAVRIYSPYKFMTHFALCDANGECALFEFLQGKLHITSGANLKVPTLTNTDYASTLPLLQKCAGQDCSPLDNSDWRFVTAANRVLNYDGSGALGTALNILDEVKQVTEVRSLWTILVEQRAGMKRLMIKNVASQMTVADLDLSLLDFSCGSPVQVMMMGAEDKGMPSGLADYTTDFQNRLVDQMAFFGNSKSDLKKMAEYPDTHTQCMARP